MSADIAASDSEEMRALQGGEDRALDRLMNRWQVPLRSFLYRHLQNEADAYDLAQETFLRVYQKRALFRPDAKFSTWMFAIAYNLARDAARSRSRKPTQPLDEAPELSDGNEPSRTAEEKEREKAVRDAIAGLPEDLRAAVVLFEYEDKSHAEIAGIVGASTKAVETRLYRARNALKKSLARYFSKAL